MNILKDYCITQFFRIIEILTLVSFEGRDN